jgi:amidase
MSVVPAISHVLNKLGSAGTRQGRQVGRRGLYLNDYWDQLLPWTQAKYDKAKYFVTGTAMSSEYAWGKYPVAYGRAMNLARKLRDDLNTTLAQFDVLIMPTVPHPARRHIVWESGPAQWNANAGRFLASPLTYVLISRSRGRLYLGV